MRMREKGCDKGTWTLFHDNIFLPQIDCLKTHDCRFLFCSFFFHLGFSSMLRNRFGSIALFFFVFFSFWFSSMLRNRYRGLKFPVNIVIVHTYYTKNNLNKVTRIQFESIPKDLSRLISLENDLQQIAQPFKPSTLFLNVRTRRGSDSLHAFLWTTALRFFFLPLEAVQHGI